MDPRFQAGGRRWVPRRRGGLGEWPFGSATADRDWDGLGDGSLSRGGGGKMGLSRLSVSLCTALYSLISLSRLWLSLLLLLLLFFF